MIQDKMMQLGKKRSTIRELFEFGRQRKASLGADKVFDFSLGNPSVPAPAAVEQAIRELLEEKDPVALHGYTSAQGDAGVRRVIAGNLKARYGVDCDPDLIYMTCGAAASLTVSLHALAGPGDEVAVLAPYFPEYRVFVEKTGAGLVEVPSLPGSFGLDLDALDRAIGEKTAALIINSPNNPTGVVLKREELLAIAALLLEKKEKYGRTVALISDEPYRELIYDGQKTALPASVYPHTLTCYSYSKALSLPGERIGYIAVSPKMENAADVYAAVCGAGRALGFVCAPALFQYVAGKCDAVLPDLAAYDENRRLLTGGLQKIGFETASPDGAFYLFVKAPDGDAPAFSEKAKKYEILLVPGDDFGGPGWARLAYCVKKETIVNALPAFEKLYKEYQV